MGIQASAEESVYLADKSGGAFERIGCRTTLADALHLAGRLDDAGRGFSEAKAMQKEQQPWYPFLYSLQGYRYCDLRLSRSRVLARAVQTLEWMSAETNAPILTVVLSHLSLGRTLLVLNSQTGAADLAEARVEHDTAMERLRQAGQQDYIARGLPARAAFFRTTGKIPSPENPKPRAVLLIPHSFWELPGGQDRVEIIDSLTVNLLGLSSITAGFPERISCTRSL